MARSSYFSRIFGTSPVTPLQKHINSVVTCVELLPDYFEAVFDRDWERAVKIQAEIVSNEELCDTIKNELRLHLPSSLFMPIDRRDVLEVLGLQDAIANISKDIAGLVLGRKLAIPQELRQQYLDFLDRCIDAARQARVAINELDELVVTGFRGNEAERVKGMIRQLHTIEHETDEAQISLRAELYKLESDLPPVDVIFMYKVIDWTGDLADAALSTGNRLQLMLAK